MAGEVKLHLLKYLGTLLFAALLLVGVVLIVPARRSYAKQREAMLHLRAQVEEQRRIRNQLSDEVGALSTSPHAVEKVAREKFGFCREGETILRYQQRNR